MKGRHTDQVVEIEARVHVNCGGDNVFPDKAVCRFGQKRFHRTRIAWQDLLLLVALAGNLYLPFGGKVKMLSMYAR